MGKSCSVRPSSMYNATLGRLETASPGNELPQTLTTRFVACAAYSAILVPVGRHFCQWRSPANAGIASFFSGSAVELGHLEL